MLKEFDKHTHARASQRDVWHQPLEVLLRSTLSREEHHSVGCPRCFVVEFSNYLLC